MPKHPTGKRKHEIQYLWDKHYEIARLAVMGYDNAVIAETIGMTKEHISNIMCSQIFKEHLQVLRAARDTGAIDLSRRILEIAPKALKRIQEIIEEPVYVEIEQDGSMMKVKNPLADPGLALKASQDLLDRAGFNAVEKRINATYDMSELERRKRDAIQAGINLGQVIIENAEVMEVRDAQVSES